MGPEVRVARVKDVFAGFLTDGFQEILEGWTWEVNVGLERNWRGEKQDIQSAFRTVGYDNLPQGRPIADK